MVRFQASKARPALEALVAATDHVERVRGDPVELPHGYRAPVDVEVAALLSAALAYGRVDLFKPRLSKLLRSLGAAPGAVARDSTAKELLRLCKGFNYRMTGERDVACLLYGAGALIRRHGSLGEAFAAHHRASDGGSIRLALAAFIDELLSIDFTPLLGQPLPTRRVKHLLPHPGRGSACKRLNLFLRWMVRGPDRVDFGLWPVPPSALVVPLDTHVHRIGRLIGLTRRTDLSWRTAEEITAHLRQVDPADPVRFDFALSHHGISGACPIKVDSARCEVCPLRPICRVGSRIRTR